MDLQVLKAAVACLISDEELSKLLIDDVSENKKFYAAVGDAIRSGGLAGLRSLMLKLGRSKRDEAIEKFVKG